MSLSFKKSLQVSAMCRSGAPTLSLQICQPHIGRRRHAFFHGKTTTCGCWGSVLRRSSPFPPPNPTPWRFRGFNGGDTAAYKHGMDGQTRESARRYLTTRTSPACEKIACHRDLPILCCIVRNPRTDAPSAAGRLHNNSSKSLRGAEHLTGKGAEPHAPGPILPNRRPAGIPQYN